MAAVLLAVAGALTACANTPQARQFPSPPVASELHISLERVRLPDRIAEAIDVTRVYPGKHVRWAIVFVDAKIGKNLPRGDFHRRPVLVAYATEHAAMRAAATRSPSYRRGQQVLFVPSSYPRDVTREYLQASSAGLD